MENWRGLIMVDEKKYRKLSRIEEKIIVDKGTELPFSGKYNNFFEKGIYHCKRCNAALFRSDNKFKSSCGWPSFDDEIEGAVRKVPDADGARTEIQCANCGAHLGHVFKGEGFTDKNLRHCVNSISLVFVPIKNNSSLKKAYFAGGCFWGVEYHFQKIEGVISAVSGYMGGSKNDPTYEEVSTGRTGHFETVEVTYDPSVVSYEELAKLFFEIHDPTQENGQGPDIGEQYKSVIFYSDGAEKDVALKLIDILKNKGFNIVTKLLPKSRFWVAEDYHQNYFERMNHSPSCHIYSKRF